MNTPPQYWLREFNDRITDFGRGTPHWAMPISIKLRVESGCFCRSCCPEGHRLINEHLEQNPLPPLEARMIEHESGPEILTYLDYVEGVASFGAAIIGLILVIIQSRSRGIKRGDKKGDPFKLIIRRTDGNKFHEELVMKIPSDAEVDINKLSKHFFESANRIKTSASASPRRKVTGKNKKRNN